jgi:hypothetical protein
MPSYAPNESWLLGETGRRKRGFEPAILIGRYSPSRDMLGFCAPQRAQKKSHGQTKNFGIRSDPWLLLYQSSRPYDTIWLCCGEFWCCTVLEMGVSVGGPAALRAPVSGPAQLPRAGEALCMCPNSIATQDAKRKAAVAVHRRLLSVL